MNRERIEILLVEDNPGDARLIRELLSEASGSSFECVWVERLADALARLEQEEPDTILLDLSLPDSRGFETFSRLHADAADIPILVLTGLDDEALAVKTVHAGAQDYLVKGQLDSQLLTRAVRYAIERKKAGRKLARYAAELRARNEQMEADLNMAREIQLAFLPRQYASFPHGAALGDNVLRFYHRYQPTTTLAGDFFEILPLSNTQVGVFISDVMGHGVRAALVTAFLRGLIEQLRPVAAHPGPFLSAINRGLVAILRRTDTVMFASAFYLVADLSGGLVRYANAGHPEPLYVHRGSGEVELLRDGGQAPEPALGLLDEFAHKTYKKRLAANDLIFLYTDGVYEVADPDGRQFGEERLLAAVRKRILLPPDQMFDELLAEIRRFSTVREFPDDVCMVAVEVTRSDIRQESEESDDSSRIAPAGKGKSGP